MGASSGGMDGMSNPNVTGFCECCRAMELRQPPVITCLAASGPEFGSKLTNSSLVLRAIPDFDDYWSESGEGWSHGPQGLPPPTRPNLTDCKTGPSEIQIDCLKDMVRGARQLPAPWSSRVRRTCSELLVFRQGLSEKDVLDLNAGWRETTANAMRAVAKAGGWVWQMFSGRTSCSLVHFAAKVPRLRRIVRRSVCAA